MQEEGLQRLIWLVLQGALVANYPWDGSEDKGTHYEKCPDDAAYVHLAHVYANSHLRMAAPGGEFREGITNGAAWYPLWGGMQARLWFLFPALPLLWAFLKQHPSDCARLSGNRAHVTFKAVCSIRLHQDTVIGRS
jgi:hypothetical protein